ncbi:MAG: hypothetical protein AAF631_11345 [Pseudomonadota bacterium]
MRHGIWGWAALILGGCASGGLFDRSPNVAVQAPLAETVRPQPRPDPNASPAAPSGSRTTVTEATQVTAEEVAAARATTGNGRELGVTVVSLGLLEREGFWMATPLVTGETAGRIVYEVTGTTANVTLVPNGGASGSGSQLSIAAMQLLGIPLTALTEVRVFTQ